MANETPKSRIVAALRLLWLKSPERYNAIKRDSNTCQKCGVKGSASKYTPQKIEVHHKHGITNWDRIVEVIREELLCSVDKLECLCPECHKKER